MAPVSINNATHAKSQFSCHDEFGSSKGVSDLRSLPPLTALRAFEAAARLLSFQQAAQELGLTPTAISHQVRLLEDHCGKPLFRRTPRPLSLTPAGARLLPAISVGLDSFADGWRRVTGAAGERLRITATNAFAARWLVPHLPLWRAVHPEIGLDIIGSDVVLNIAEDDIDVAIRYARLAPSGLVATEIARDRYLLVASPALVGPGPVDLSPVELAKLPLIDAQWPEDAVHPPMWFEWQRVAQTSYSEVPDLERQVGLSFREDLHGIEAAIAGHGVAICSDILVGTSLADRTLVQVSPVTLEGYGFFTAHRPQHGKLKTIDIFEAWLAAQF